MDGSIPGSNSTKVWRALAQACGIETYWQSQCPKIKDVDVLKEKLETRAAGFVKERAAEALRACTRLMEAVEKKPTEVANGNPPS